MRNFLIVFHCQGQATQVLAEAARDGALLEAGVETRLVRAADAGLEDLLWAHALLIASPENFGYMAGMIKDFFDRTFYPAQGKIQNLPYAVLIKCSNDGTGALSNIERIARGYPFKQGRRAADRARRRHRRSARLGTGAGRDPRGRVGAGDLLSKRGAQVPTSSS